MIIKLNKTDMKAEVFNNDGVLQKEQSISKDDYISLNRELSGDRIDMVRVTNKLFKPKCITYYGVKK